MQLAAEDCVKQFHEKYFARFCRSLRVLFGTPFGPWTFIKLEFSDGSFEIGLVNFGSFVEYTSQHTSLPRTSRSLGSAVSLSAVTDSQGYYFLIFDVHRAVQRNIFL